MDRDCPFCHRSTPLLTCPYCGTVVAVGDVAMVKTRPSPEKRRKRGASDLERLLAVVGE